MLSNAIDFRNRRKVQRPKSADQERGGGGICANPSGGKTVILFSKEKNSSKRSIFFFFCLFLVNHFFNFGSNSNWLLIWAVSSNKKRNICQTKFIIEVTISFVKTNTLLNVTLFFQMILPSFHPLWIADRIRWTVQVYWLPRPDFPYLWRRAGIPYPTWILMIWWYVHNYEFNEFNHLKKLRIRRP